MLCLSSKVRGATIFHHGIYYLTELRSLQPPNAPQKKKYWYFILPHVHYHYCDGKDVGGRHQTQNLAYVISISDRTTSQPCYMYTIQRHLGYPLLPAVWFNWDVDYLMPLRTLKITSCHIVINNWETCIKLRNRDKISTPFSQENPVVSDSL